MTWEVKRLGDLYDITSSKRVFKSEWKQNGVPFYRAREIVKLAKQGFVENELFISEEMYKKYSEKYGVPKELDIMVTGVGTLGICYVVKKNDKFYFKDGNIIWFKRKSDINSRFIEYAFKSDLLRKQIDNSMGATVGTYTIIKAKNTILPIPSLSEQKRIVAILDEAFESIARAKESAEKNLKNANEIFESYLQSVFENKGEGWDEKKLGSLSKFVSVGHVGPTSKFYCEKHEGIPFLRSQNVRPAKLSMKGIRYILPEFHKKLKKSQLKSGDLLFVRVGANRGECCSLPENLGEINCANIVFARPTEASPKFLELFCLSQIGRKRLLGMTTGSAQGVINTKSVAELLIPLPNIKEQLAIEKKFNLISAETKKLEIIYTQKLADLEELKKSILAKAFNGELTEASA